MFLRKPREPGVVGPELQQDREDPESGISDPAQGAGSLQQQDCRD